MSARTQIFLLAARLTVLKKHRGKMMLSRMISFVKFMNIQSPFVVAKVMHFFRITTLSMHFFCEIMPFFLLIVEKSL